MKNVKLIIAMFLVLSQSVSAQDPQTTLNVIKSVTQTLVVNGTLDVALNNAKTAMQAYYNYQNKIALIQSLQTTLNGKKMELNSQQLSVISLSMVPATLRTAEMSAILDSASLEIGYLNENITMLQTRIDALQNNP